MFFLQKKEKEKTKKEEKQKEEKNKKNKKRKKKQEKQKEEKNKKRKKTKKGKKKKRKQKERRREKTREKMSLYDSTNNTETLEEKKNASKQNETKKLSSFLQSVRNGLFTLIKFTILSCIVLYCSHLAKQEILPLDLEKYPFQPGSTQEDTVPAAKQNTNEKDTILGNTFTIEFIAQQKNTLLDFLRGKKNKTTTTNTDEKQNVVSEFLTKQFISVIFYNLQAFMVFFQFLADWNEILVMIVGPILFVLFLGFLSLFGAVFFVYYYFLNISILTKNNSLFLNILFPFLFICILICCFLGVFIIQFLGILYSLATLLCYQCTLKNNRSSNTDEAKEQNILRFFVRFVFHFQNLFMAVIGILVSSSAYSNLGITEAIASIGILIMIASGMLGIQMFQNPSRSQSNNMQGGGGSGGMNKNKNKNINEYYSTRKRNGSLINKFSEPKEFNRMLKEFYSLVKK